MPSVIMRKFSVLVCIQKPFTCFLGSGFFQCKRWTNKEGVLWWTCGFYRGGNVKVFIKNSLFILLFFVALKFKKCRIKLHTKCICAVDWFCDWSTDWLIGFAKSIYLLYIIWDSKKEFSVETISPCELNLFLPMCFLFHLLIWIILNTDAKSIGYSPALCVAAVFFNISLKTFTGPALLMSADSSSNIDYFH